jgi:hypothetical protein
MGNIIRQCEIEKMPLQETSQYIVVIQVNLSSSISTVKLYMCVHRSLKSQKDHIHRENMVIAFVLPQMVKRHLTRSLELFRFARTWTVPPVVISRNDGLAPDNLLLDTLREFAKIPYYQSWGSLRSVDLHLNL